MSKTLQQHMAQAQAIIKDCERSIVCMNYRNFHRKLKKEIEKAMQSKRYADNKAQQAKK